MDNYARAYSIRMQYTYQVEIVRWLMNEAKVPLRHGCCILGLLPDSTDATMNRILIRREARAYTTTVSFMTGTLWVSTMSNSVLSELSAQSSHIEGKGKLTALDERRLAVRYDNALYCLNKFIQSLRDRDVPLGQISLCLFVLVPTREVDLIASRAHHSARQRRGDRFK